MASLGVIPTTLVSNGEPTHSMPHPTLCAGLRCSAAKPHLEYSTNPGPMSKPAQLWRILSIILAEPQDFSALPMYVMLLMIRPWCRHLELNGVDFPYSRGLSFYEVNDEGKIVSARDIPEPTIKPGDSAIYVMPLLQCHAP